MTPITQRVSGSLHTLARRNGALIIPWVLTYQGFHRSEEALRYRPIQLILRRLVGPEATILCRQDVAIDPAGFLDQESLSVHVRELYARRLDGDGTVA